MVCLYMIGMIGNHEANMSRQGKKSKGGLTLEEIERRSGPAVHGLKSTIAMFFFMIFHGISRFQLHQLMMFWDFPMTVMAWLSEYLSTPIDEVIS